MTDTTPTPPADTRQQAAQRVHEALVDYVNEYGWPMRGDGIHLSRHLATALASSSPALPEPPAPTDEPRHEHDDDTSVWLGQWREYDLWWAPQGSLPTLIARTGPEGDYTSGAVFEATFPALAVAGERARRRGLPLLAAADVAEEQQP